MLWRVVACHSATLSSARLLVCTSAVHSPSYYLPLVITVKTDLRTSGIGVRGGTQPKHMLAVQSWPGSVYASARVCALTSRASVDWANCDTSSASRPAISHLTPNSFNASTKSFGIRPRAAALSGRLMAAPYPRARSGREGGCGCKRLVSKQERPQEETRVWGS